MRLTKDEYLMRLAKVAATRTTCIRRGVGCVLADERGHVLAIGYNGVAAGLPHCNEAVPTMVTCSTCNGACEVPTLALNRWGHVVYTDCPTCCGLGIQDSPVEDTHPHACKGAHLPPGQDQCEAVHAEQNAVIQCRDVSKVHTAYVTLSPCKACLKLLLNTGCRELVVGELHTDTWPLELWTQAGRAWRLLEVSDE